MHSGEFLLRHCRLAQVRRARTKFCGDLSRSGGDTPDPSIRVHRQTDTQLSFIQLWAYKKRKCGKVTRLEE